MFAEELGLPGFPSSGVFLDHDNLCWTGACADWLRRWGGWSCHGACIKGHDLFLLLTCHPCPRRCAGFLEEQIALAVSLGIHADATLSSSSPNTLRLDSLLRVAHARAGGLDPANEDDQQV